MESTSVVLLTMLVIEGPLMYIYMARSAEMEIGRLIECHAGRNFYYLQPQGAHGSGKGDLNTASKPKAMTCRPSDAA